MPARSTCTAAILLTLLGGCDGSALADASIDATTSLDASTSGDASSMSQPGIDPTSFVDGALAESPETEPCTLTNGVETTCYRVTIAGAPADHAVGPFCPRNISDGADVGGLWIENDEVWDLSGAFIANLATFYDDPAWQLYDPETGAINVTETLEACEAAARPDVDPAYQNYCVECALEDLGGGVEATMLIPTVPTLRASAMELDRRGSVGLSLSGVVFDPPAPVDAILGAYTIAAFDDCGGHVNPFAGYHYHAATGCSAEVAQSDGHAPLIGYARDGFGMHAMLNEDGQEPDDLDVCRGHEDAVRGYHYHVASAGENQFIGCFMGEVAR